MRNVTIHCCPVCDTIKTHSDQLVADLQGDPELEVSVVDGDKGEFAIEVDGQRIDGKRGDSPRDSSELAAEIRGMNAAV